MKYATSSDDVGLLRSHGLRVTSPRLSVLAALRTYHGHCTADEISDEVRQLLPTVNAATIYRALHDLRDAGLVAETDVGQKCLVYEFVGERHHHVVCVQCRAEWEIDDEILEPVKEALLERYGFHARLDHFAIFGRCAHCAGD